MTYVPGTWSGVTGGIVTTLLSNGAAVPGAITGTNVDTTACGGTLISIAEVTNIGAVTATSTEAYCYTDSVAYAFRALQTGTVPLYADKALDAIFQNAGFKTALAEQDVVMYIGPDAQGTLLDWSSNHRTITKTGNFQFDAYSGFHGITGADGFSLGFAANAATKYTQNAGSLIAWVKSSVANNNNYCIGTADVSSFLRADIVGGNSNGRANSASGGPSGNAGTSGMIHVRRTTSTAAELRKDKVQIATDATVSQARSASPFKAFQTASGANNAPATLVLKGLAIGNTSDTNEGALFDGFALYDTLTTPRNFLFFLGGQSLNYLLSQNGITSNAGITDGSGDTTAGSNAIQRILTPALQAYIDTQYNDGRPNIIKIVNYAVGSSSLNKSAGNSAALTWWDDTVPTTGAPAFLATSMMAPLTTILNATTYDAIFFDWNQGQADIGGTTAAYVNGFTQFSTWLRAQHAQLASLKIDIWPMNSNPTVAESGIQNVRLAEDQIIANIANTTMGLDYNLLARQTNGWHLLSETIAADGADYHAAFLARVAAHNLGCTAVKWQGPEIASAATVNATTYDVTLTYPAGCGGTDFSPASGIVGFIMYDNGVEVVGTVTGVHQSATVIRVTCPAIVGTPTIAFDPTRHAFTTPSARANLPRDNFSTGFALKAMLTPIAAP